MLRAVVIASLIAMTFILAPSAGAEDLRNPGTPWPATDALGRPLPLAEEVGPPRDNRFVGIFYFLWLGQDYGHDPYDIAKILARDPEALKKGDSPLWGPRGRYHFWAEPLLGYYNTMDPWVLRRHAHLLADAGVDTLIFDTTNAVTYPAVYTKLCEVFTQIRREGGRTPQLCFMVNSQAGRTARKIYEELYEPGRFRELWFRWQGKPLMICDPAEADPEVKAFFTLRRAHWPFDLVNTKRAWHWESTYPQVYGYADDPNVPEQVNVAVAQNLRVSDGRVTNMSDGNARGRSFHDGKIDTTPGSVNWGHNVREQWRRAVKLDPPFVMVTGWNEWIAGRWGEAGGPPVFVDQYDQQCSRDIEPMKGGHGDNYYLQLIANVRRYKGAVPLPKTSAAATIAIEGGFEQWRDVAPEFADHPGDTLHRDHRGFGRTHYTETTGRNDLVGMKVARDDRNVYFYARTREAITLPSITPSANSHWMTLLIDADRNRKTGWEGFDFAVNRTAPLQKPNGNAARLEKYIGDGSWEYVAPIRYRVADNEIHLSIPRSALGLPAGRTTLDFKWADNIRNPAGVMDFYISGDVAPDGRLMYRYQTE